MRNDYGLIRSRPISSMKRRIHVAVTNFDQKERGKGSVTMDSPRMNEKFPTADEVSPVAWPVWARSVVSVMLVMHIAAVLSGAFAAAEPASALERRIADVFFSYHQVIDQGYTYRYYAPEPGPTPVVTAKIHYSDGRPDEELRLPDAGLGRDSGISASWHLPTTSTQSSLRPRW